MATLPTSPTLRRPNVPPAGESKSTLALDSRPYLVTESLRKTARSTQSYLALFPHESEDARLTGATRSLYRRLLGLNLPGRVTAVASPTAGEVAKAVFAGFKIA